jgi:hypothetical protein
VKLRIEFIEGKASSFKRVLGICRKIKTFKRRLEDGITIYSIDFKEEDVFAAEAVNDFVHAWKGTAYYADGALISRGRAWTLISQASRDIASRAYNARTYEGPRHQSPAAHIIPAEVVPDRRGT